MKQKITCFCGYVLSVDVDDSIDLDKNPELLDKILDGTFMSFTCSGCDKKHKPEFPITVSWPSRKLKFEVLPEFDRGEFYRRKKDPAGVETIISYPELADRLLVIHDGLEPIAVEALKYFLLLKAEETYPDKETNVWYHSTGAFGPGDQPESIEFHLHGIREDEVAVSRIPWDLYEKTLMDYKKKPKQELFAGLRVRSYLSVHNMRRPDGL